MTTPLRARLLVCLALCWTVLERPAQRMWGHANATDQASSSHEATLTTGHPRLMFTQETLADIRRKMALDSPGGYQDFKTSVNINTPPGNFTNGAVLAQTLMATAWVSNVDPSASVRETFRDYGVRLVDKAIASFCTHASFGNDWYWPHIYDWMFNALTEAQRAALLDCVGHHTSALLTTTYPTNAPPMDGSVVRSKLIRVLYGIAASNDRLGSPATQTKLHSWYEWTAHGGLFGTRTDNGVTYEGIAQADTWWAGAQGGWSEGFPYSGSGDVGARTRVLGVCEAYRTAHAKTPTEVYGARGPCGVWLKWPQLVLAQILPYTDGSQWKFFKMQNQSQSVLDAGGINRDHLTIVEGLSGALATVDKGQAGLAEYLRSMYGKLDKRMDSAGSLVHMSIMALTMRSAAPASVAPSTVLSSMLNTDPMGIVYMRHPTWDQSTTATQVTFQRQRYTLRGVAGHANQIHNSFTITRRGAGIVNAGRSTHDNASNEYWTGGGVFDLVDTAHKFTLGTIGLTDNLGRDAIPFSHGGASKYPSKELVPRSPWEISRNWRTREATGTEPHYLYADFTPLYHATKQSRLTRSLVYQPRVGGGPDYLLVFDRVDTSSAQYEKRLLLPMAGVPTVTADSRAAGPPRGPGPATNGHTTYTNASRIHYSNRLGNAFNELWVTPLLPASPKVVVVGGPSDDRNLWGVELAANLLIASYTRSGNTATVVTNLRHDLQAGDRIYIQGVDNDRCFNVSGAVIATTPASPAGGRPAGPTSLTFPVSGCVATTATIDADVRILGPFSRDPINSYGYPGDKAPHFGYPSEDGHYSQWIGQYRAEIIRPTETADPDQFFTVFEIADGDATQTSAVLVPTSPNFKCGAVGGTKVYCFGDVHAVSYTGRAETVITNGSVVLSSAGTYTIWIGDLGASVSLTVTGSAGCRSIVKSDGTDNSSPFTTSDANGEAGTLHLTVVSTGSCTVSVG